MSRESIIDIEVLVILDIFNLETWYGVLEVPRSDIIHFASLSYLSRPDLYV